MPTTQILSAPAPSWPVELAFPHPPNVTAAPSFIWGSNNSFHWLSGGLGQSAILDPYLAGGAAGGNNRTTPVYNGRWCAMYACSGANFYLADALRMNWWNPYWIPGAGVYAGGGWVSPSSVVGVWDISLALPAPGAGVVVTQADSTGWFFVPQSTAGTPWTAHVGGSTSKGGFGLSVNWNAGIADFDLDFISWDGGGVLQRIAAPASWAADTTAWHAARIIVVTGTEARAARLIITLDGAAWVDQYWDDVLLKTPDTLDPGGSSRFAFNFLEYVDSGGACTANVRVAQAQHWRFGPQLPDGTIIQQP